MVSISLFIGVCVISILYVIVSCLLNKKTKLEKKIAEDKMMQILFENAVMKKIIEDTKKSQKDK